MKYIQKHIITLLTILLLLVGGFSSEMWGGRTHTGYTAVAEGKGTATVKIFWRKYATDAYDKREGASNSTSGSTLVSASYERGTTQDGSIVFYATASAGYTFSGWYVNSSCSGNALSNSSPYIAIKNAFGNNSKTAYAKFTPKTYKINFFKEEFKEGSYQEAFHTATATYDARYNQATNWIDNTTKEGYTFDGWHTKDGTLVNPTDKYQTDGNQALYAHWKAYLTLDHDGGSSKTSKIEVSYNSSTNLTGTIEKPTKSGWEFHGYYTGKNGTGVKIIDKDGNVVSNAGSGTYTDADKKWKYASGGITVYAYWAHTYYGRAVAYPSPVGNGKIWVSCNNYKPANEGVYFTEKDSSNWFTIAQSNPTCSADYFALANTGYSFQGWFTDKNGAGTKTGTTADYSEDFTVTSTNSNARTRIVRYAYFTPNTYTVTFNANGTGASVSPTSKTVTYDSTYGAGTGGWPTPTREGYIFVGWFTDDKFTTEIESTTPVKILKNQTLYAKWTPITYTVVFNANGGSGDKMANQGFTYDVAQNLSANTYTRAGYKFGSWNRETNGSGASYTNGQSVSNLANTNGATVNLYAQWTAVTVNSVASNTSPLSFTKPESKDATVVFNVSNAAATSDFTYNVTGNGWTFVSWSYASNQVTVTVRFTCTATTAQGAHAGTVTLTSKETGHNYKTANVVANVDLTPSVTITSGAPVAFGTYTLAKDTRKSATVTLAFNENALEYSISAVTAPFYTSWSADHKTLTVSFEPTSADTYETDITVTVKNNQTPKRSASQTIHVTGAAVRNTRVVNKNTIQATYLVDDATLNLPSMWTSTGDGVAEYKRESFTPLNDKNAGLKSAPTISNDNKLSLGQAGTLVISMVHRQTTNYEADSVTQTITINKRPNTLTCDWPSWKKTLNFDERASVHIGSNNSIAQTPIVVTPASGTTYGQFRPDSITHNGDSVLALCNVGTATWTVSQAENYKYQAAAQKTLTLKVETIASNCDVIPLRADVKNISTVEDINLPKAGAGDTLFFEMQKNGTIWGNNSKLTAYDASGNQVGYWEPVAEALTHFNSCKIKLPEGTNLLSFSQYSSDDPYIKNIRVSRKKWLTIQNKEGSTISSLTIPTNSVNGTKTAKFYIDYSVCADKIKVSSNHPHITVSETVFDVSPIRKEITVSYTSPQPEQVTATITVYTPSEVKTLTVNAETEKPSPELIWGTLYQVEPVMLPVTFSDDSAAVATNDLPVTYSINPGEESVIEVALDGLSFTVVGTGTAHLTATTQANDTWKSISETKEIQATNKKIQNIVWDQTFTRSLSLNDEKSLTAQVHVYNVATKTEEVSAARTALIQYSCPENNGVIEKIDDTHIRIIGYGETTITASVVGDVDYAAATPVTKLVRVRELQNGECEPALMTEIPNEIEFFAFDWNTPEIAHNVALDRSNGIPDKLSFYVRGVSYDVAIQYYRGSIDVYQSTDGGLTWGEKLTSVGPEKNTTALSDTIQLNPNATHLRFVRAKGGLGYHYIGGINVTSLPKIEVTNTNINLGSIGVGSVYNGSIPVSYANVKGDLTVTKLYNNGLTVDDVIEAECGESDSRDLHFSLIPTTVGAWSNKVTIRDNIRNMSVEVTLTATITKGSQSIKWNPTTTIYPNQAPLLNATVTSNLPVSYSLTSGSSVAEIVAGAVVIKSLGSFTITASQAGDADNFFPADNVVKTFTVIALPLDIVEAPTASTITDEQKLKESTLSGGTVNDILGNNVVGTWAWQNPDAKYDCGTHYPTVVFTPTVNPTWWYSGNTTTTTLEVIQSTYRYEGEGLWSDAENWNRGTTPGPEDEVIINGNVTISETVEVKGLTINEGSNVTLTVEGQLTVGNGDSKVLDGYGDLVVENGGKVILNDGELKVKDLIIEARLGDLEHSASSAEIDGEALLNVNGDVYFKLSFDPSGSISFGWYDFVVPFEVDVVGGIFLPSDTHTPLKNKVDYAIMEFSEEKYAAQQKFWLWNNTTLQPGKLYSITLDETKPYRNTFLFKRKGNATIGAPASYRPSCTNEAKNTNKGWNGMGNGTLKHRQLSLPKGANPRIQVYDHANDCYVTCDAKDFQYAIGTAFFVQVSSSETINLMEVNSNRNFRAPVHETETTDEFIVTLKEENAEIVSDRLWFSASEEATGEYIIGRDLVKMGEPKDAKVARMWAVRDDLRLCDAEMPLIYSEADCAIDLFAPKQATYILEVEQAPEDAELYLTYNGKVIWNLTASPSSIVLTQGTKEGYGLRIKSNKASTPQGIEDTNVENNTMRKVLIDNTMYVITPQGAMYNVTGKFVR